MKLRDLLDLMQKTAIKIDCAQPYICGGVGRDRYLNKLENIVDLDITTGDKTVDYLSQEFTNELKKKYNITRKTMEDGHSSIFMGNLKLDFSSNFNAPNIDLHLKKLGITNPTSTQRELYSRDFSCNALLLSLDLKNIIDPTHNGFRDIDDRRLKTCLSPEITLTSNRNRVIRAVYLATKLDFEIDKSIIDYVTKNPKSVNISTKKSLTEKLTESFKKDADKASYWITKMNLWNYIPILEIMQPYYTKNIKTTNYTPIKGI